MKTHLITKLHQNQGSLKSDIINELYRLPIAKKEQFQQTLQAFYLSQMA